jgi:6-phosphogluconolactonase
VAEGYYGYDWVKYVHRVTVEKIKLNKNKLCIMVEENKESLAETGARLFERKSLEAVEKQGRFLVALAGGSSPRGMHKRLGALSSIPWQDLHIFWGDERCVPVDDPSSNYGAAWSDFIGRVPVRAEQIHPMPGHETPRKGALLYEKELRQVFDLQEPHVPAFDLIVLGLGKDGHTASLFPGHPSVKETEALVVAVKGGDPDVHRLTFTFPVINAARGVMFIVSGKDKAGAVKAVIEDQEETRPASKVRLSSGDETWLLDREAASLLKEATLSAFSCG